MQISVSKLAAVFLFFSPACGGQQGSAEAPSQTATTTDSTDADPPPQEGAPPLPMDGPGVDRPEMSAQECEAQGGHVVGDIGDGAIHQPSYTCPAGGPPVANISATEGGPMGVEGSVCCK